MREGSLSVSSFGIVTTGRSRNGPSAGSPATAIGLATDSTRAASAAGAPGSSGTATRPAPRMPASATAYPNCSGQRMATPAPGGIPASSSRRHQARTERARPAYVRTPLPAASSRYGASPRLAAFWSIHSLSNDQAPFWSQAVAASVLDSRSRAAGAGAGAGVRSGAAEGGTAAAPTGAESAGTAPAGTAPVATFRCEPARRAPDRKSVV